MNTIAREFAIKRISQLNQDLDESLNRYVRVYQRGFPLGLDQFHLSDIENDFVRMTHEAKELTKRHSLDISHFQTFRARAIDQIMAFADKNGLLKWAEGFASKYCS